MKNQKGVAMVTAVVVAVIGLSIAGALAMNVQSRHKDMINKAELREAEMIAYSGLEKIRRLLYVFKTNSTWNWSDVLKYNQNFSTDMETIKTSTTNSTSIQQCPYCQPGTTCYHTQNTYNTSYMETMEPQPPTDKTNPGSSPVVFGTPTSFSKGSFHVVIRNDNDEADPLNDANDRLDAIITATSSSGAMMQIKVRLRFDSGMYSPLHALVTGGSVQIFGNTQIQGTLGSVHTNANASVTAPASISKTLSAVGTVTLTNSPVIGGGYTQFVPTLPLPEVDPNKYKSGANYVLKADGSVINNQTGATIVTLGNNGMWNGFKYQNAMGGRWEANGNAVLESASYFFETKFTINGNVTANATFLVDNSVDIAGTAGVSGNGNMTIIAKGDMTIMGTATLKGFLASQEQIKIGGTPNVIGSILARDKQDLFNDVSTQSQVYPDSVFGNATITYNAQTVTMLETAKRVAPVSIQRLK